VARNVPGSTSGSSSGPRAHPSRISLPSEKQNTIMAKAKKSKKPVKKTAKKKSRR
jgi:hypothetical protein